MTGVQIDAIYHTAVVFNNVEYFFGQGIHRKVPGSTHHGQPMSIVKLGETELPLDVIEEYIESLESVYTPESYDLFVHNCNNFSQDLAMFLVGKSIPGQIRALPETFLNTPMGQMLRGQIDQSMRTMTQAPDAVAGRNVSKTPTITQNGVTKGTSRVTAPVFVNGEHYHVEGRVHQVTSTSELDQLLRSAESSCAVVFFTSATCPPCKIVYPAYDELAAEAGDRAVLIKIDISNAYDVALRYSVRATPTFITFLKGKKEDEWAGANEAQLRGNVRLLVQTAHPQHPHSRLRLPTLQRFVKSPIMYTRVPPLDKLLTKIGAPAQEAAVQDLVKFIKLRAAEGMAEAALPDLHRFGDFIASSFDKLPLGSHFAVVDLVRAAAADPRVSSFLVVEENQRTLSTLIPADRDYSSAPYNLQAVTLQLACNLFGSTVFQESLHHASSKLRVIIEHVASSGLLSTHSNARALSAALVYNLAAFDHNERLEGRKDRLDLSSMVELEAALVEAVVNETESKETLHSLLLALGLLLYAAPPDSSIWDLCGAMEVKPALSGKRKNKALTDEPLLKEIGDELLGKGGFC